MPFSNAWFVCQSWELVGCGMYLFYFSTLYLRYYSPRVCLEIRYHKASSFAVFARECFGIQDILCFHMNFRIFFSVFVKNAFIFWYGVHTSYISLDDKRYYKVLILQLYGQENLFYVFNLFYHYFIIFIIEVIHIFR
jgi:hypothetical protein